MKDLANLDRRSFIVAAAAGGGFSLGLLLPSDQSGVRAADGGPEVTAWVVVRSDDTIAVRIVRSEMGQGTLTGLAQLVAEELEADWSKITTEYPTPSESVARKRVWGDFSTSASRGIRASQEYVRQGGAAARMMLIQAAANEWRVPAAECTVANSVITHRTTGRSVTFGKVAQAASRLDPPADVKLKDPRDWRIAGKPLKRLDTRPKLTGEMVYGIDVKLPGMLCAAIKDAPVFGSKVKSYDQAKIADMPGVKKVVQVGDSAVAVVADIWWNAKNALAALPINWDDSANAKVSSASIAEWLETGLNADQNFVGNQKGDTKTALTNAAKIVEAVYAWPFQHQATLEPMNATALYTPDKCEVWCGTQNSELVLATVAEASGLPVARCDVYKVFPGGGFGRRSRTDYVRQAVLIAKQMPGIPVKLLWSREEDMTHGTYHPITQCRMKGSFDANNNLTGLQMTISGQSILASVFPASLQNGKDPIVFQGLNPGGTEGALGYDIPNVLIEHAMRNPHIPPGFWRGVNHNQNAIYLESFIDELASASGQDPLAFRRRLMANNPKHLAVLNAVAEKAGWGKPAPGVYRGLAQQMGCGSYAAACAEVSVSNAGKLKVHRVVAAIDPGYFVNPAQVERQVCGSVVFSLSALLYGECTVNGGRVEQENFDTYKVMRKDEMPRVETIIMPSGGFWGGVGEPVTFVTAPAVLNAIFAATGRRFRSFPLIRHDLR